MLTIEGCRHRQQGLVREMQQQGWTSLLTSNFRTVYYFSGVLSAPAAPTIFWMRDDGSATLITSAQAGDAAADRVVALETYSIERAITEPIADAARLLRQEFSSQAAALSCCAVERSTTAALVEQVLRDAGHKPCADASRTILKLRKFKEPDEIGEIRESLRYCSAAYRAAKETIAPGLTELDVYNAMHRAIVQEAGASVRFPGDFACGERAIGGGGAPTRRKILPGDLYILDIFPEPHLYFGDVCRTFAATTPTDAQMRAWEVVRQAVRLGESAVKPGVAARDVYRLIKEFLDAHEITQKSFWHHAGHGIGHNGHEAPRIIPGTDDIFEVGDVITLEPGVYSRALQGGIRIEDNYQVTESGLVNLFDFPMDL